MDHLEEEVPPEILEDYHACALYTLMKEFPRFPLNDLKRILVENKSRFPPSHRIISAEYQVALAEEQEKAPTRGTILHVVAELFEDVQSFLRL
jgi:hypothetical protein